MPILEDLFKYVYRCFSIDLLQHCTVQFHVKKTILLESCLPPGGRQVIG